MVVVIVFMYELLCYRARRTHESWVIIKTVILAVQCACWISNGKLESAVRTLCLWENRTLTALMMTEWRHSLFIGHNHSTFATVLMRRERMRAPAYAYSILLAISSCSSSPYNREQNDENWLVLYCSSNPLFIFILSIESTQKGAVDFPMMRINSMTIWHLIVPQPILEAAQNTRTRIISTCCKQTMRAEASPLPISDGVEGCWSRTRN